MATLYGLINGDLGLVATIKGRSKPKSTLMLIGHKACNSGIARTKSSLRYKLVLPITPNYFCQFVINIQRKKLEY